MKSVKAKQKPTKAFLCRFLPDTTLTYVNNEYCLAFGKSREELTGTKFIDMIPPNERDQIEAHVASLNSNPRGLVREHQVIITNNHRDWHQWVDYPIYDDNLSVVGFRSLGRPIPNPSPVDHHPIQMIESICPCEDRILSRHGIRVVVSCDQDEIKLLTYDVDAEEWLVFGHQSVEAATGSDIPNADFYFHGIGFIEDAFTGYCQLTLRDGPSVWAEVYKSIGSKNRCECVLS